MKFKSARIMAQYELLPDKLQEIAEAFVQLSKDNGIEAVVTRVCDPVAGESGVHRDHRAIDFRNEYIVGESKRCLYSLEMVEEILLTINEQFPRSDKFKTLIHHSFHGGLLHFHLQIPIQWVISSDVRKLNGHSH